MVFEPSEIFPLGLIDALLLIRDKMVDLRQTLGASGLSQLSEADRGGVFAIGIGCGDHFLGAAGGAAETHGAAGENAEIADYIEPLDPLAPAVVCRIFADSQLFWAAV